LCLLIFAALFPFFNRLAPLFSQETPPPFCPHSPSRFFRMYTKKFFAPFLFAPFSVLSPIFFDFLSHVGFPLLSCFNFFPLQPPPIDSRHLAAPCWQNPPLYGHRPWSLSTPVSSLSITALCFEYPLLPPRSPVPPLLPFVTFQVAAFPFKNPPCLLSQPFCNLTRWFSKRKS